MRPGLRRDREWRPSKRGASHDGTAAVVTKTGAYFCVIQDGHDFLLLTDTVLLPSSDVSIADVPLEDLLPDSSV
jgi:hypothetical protein